MSGSQITPGEIPGTDVVPESITAAATGYRATAAAIREKSTSVVSTWSGLSAVYVTPDSPRLLTSMDPVATDAHSIASRLTRAAGFIDAMAEAVVAPVRRLKELKVEAETFVNSVKHGVTVGYYDSDNPNFLPHVLGFISSNPLADKPDSTIPWDQHNPSVDRNNQLLDEVNQQVAKLLAARAECVNGINALHDDACMIAEVAPTAKELNGAKNLPWGAEGNGDRSCSESVGDGLYSFGSGFVNGLGAMIGHDAEKDTWEWGTTGATWGGIAQGLGALLLTVAMPANSILAARAPAGTMPEWVVNVSDWQKQHLNAMVEGIVGTPEQWAEDPVAAGTYAVASIGTFFIPVVGVAGGGAKLASVLTRVGIATERLAVIAGDGTRLATGLTRAGDLLGHSAITIDRLSHTVTLNGVLERLGTRLDHLPNIVPDNLTAHHQPALMHAGGETAAGAHAAENTVVQHSADGGGGSHSSGTQVLEHPNGADHAPSGSHPPTGGSHSPTGSSHSDGSGHSDDTSPANAAPPVKDPAPVVVRDTFDPLDARDYTSGDPHRPGFAEQTSPPESYVKGGTEDGWKLYNRPDVGWARYQEQIAGVERSADGRLPEYVVNDPDGKPVAFDGVAWRGVPPQAVLLDAKNFSAGIAYGDRTTGYWRSRATSIVLSANRQLAALPEGASLEWHVSDPAAASTVRTILAAKDILPDDVRVIYTPRQ